MDFENRSENDHVRVPRRELLLLLAIYLCVSGLSMAFVSQITASLPAPARWSFVFVSVIALLTPALRVWKATRQSVVPPLSRMAWSATIIAAAIFVVSCIFGFAADI